MPAPGMTSDFQRSASRALLFEALSSLLLPWSKGFCQGWGSPPRGHLCHPLDSGDCSPGNHKPSDSLLREHKQLLNSKLAFERAGLTLRKDVIATVYLWLLPSDSLSSPLSLQVPCSPQLSLSASISFPLCLIVFLSTPPFPFCHPIPCPHCLPFNSS